MQILIVGGTGFVGGHLVKRFLDSGHGVTVTGTRPESRLASDRRFQYLQADTAQPGPWQQAVGRADVIINLAGRTIFRRWSVPYKQAIYDSRILTTRNIVAALPEPSTAALVSTSAVGYYGNGGDALLTEDAAPGDDFLGVLAREWEAAALAAAAKGVRVAIARFGIVLGEGGGALAAMLPAFRLGLGGPLGNGRQWFPWIHLGDLAGAIEWLALRDDLQGSFNLCAPNPATNKELAQTLGRVLGRPAFVPAPALVLKLLLGEMAGVLLSGQRAVPAKLLAAGFEFRYPRLEKALTALLHKD
ncbi:MAG: TIGR01777 family oxidoreductase [Desulfobacteraceae bacterium]|nr:TIGR01777 family oxidoreductase [Desulfobacteraceae bacterium]